MGTFKGTHLLDSLGLRGGVSGVFGIAYSILDVSGRLKGVSVSPATWGKLIAKTFEDGHATAFVIDVDERWFTMSGMGDAGWVFNTARLDQGDWARQSLNADTDVYFTTGDDLPDRFRRVERELNKQKAEYVLVMPNVLGFSTRYETSVSSAHYIVYKMGLGSWAASNALWVPALRNLLTWFASDGQAWQHHRFPNCNTNIPR